MSQDESSGKVCEFKGGRVITRWIADDTIEAFYSGDASAALVEEARRHFWQVAGGRPVRFLLVDSLALTRLDPNAIYIGGRFMNTFKAQGGKMFILVVKLDAIRMMVSSFMFILGIQGRMVRSREEALELIAQTRAGAPEKAT
ncbi:MAG: hypothetical protein HUU21_18255 [Polyangiaceae bacterium]|nr:hypothetical protein [Polyangiaceae bacterium]NUQ75493.1 hypothetical protein [Polyangiaceae bacterium]